MATVYTNYADKRATYVDYEVGDIVVHTLNHSKFVVGKIYHKLNKVVVEDAEGKEHEFFATSLVAYEECLP